MFPTLTSYVWLDLLLIGLLVGAGWTLGTAIVAALLGAFKRQP